ncbi:MAG: hypothetical protein ACR2NT_04825 [Acidimicrobiia bacterium]|nr:hypothetical protein [Acidimicrobiia bacterium]MDQ3501908.1 hypothetical protein [Actinomycetota bacterium]
MEVVIRKRLTGSEKEVRFAEVYRLYGKHIRAYCTRRTDHSDVADAVAETFLVAWRDAARELFALMAPLAT